MDSGMWAAAGPRFLLLAVGRFVGRSCVSLSAALTLEFMIEGFVPRERWLSFGVSSKCTASIGYKSNTTTKVTRLLLLQQFDLNKPLVFFGGPV